MKPVGFVGLLAIVLITLKLARIGVVADWSWWWVLAPLWAGPVALIIGLIGYTAYLLIRHSRRHQ